MNDKASLLNQLRIERAPTSRGTGGWVWWLLGAALLLVAVAGAWWFLWRDDAIAVRAVTAEAVATGNPAGGASLLDASGYVVARRAATVAAKITDRVVDVLIEEGQHVAADEIIARLDDSNTGAALAQAKAQVAQVQANLAAARIAAADAIPLYQRQQKLQAAGWASTDTLETAKSSYDAAQSALLVAERNLAAAEAGLAVAQRNQDDTIVRAPFAGIVTVKAAQPGEIVSPISAGGGFTRTGIGTIVDMDSLEAEIDVSENFINRVHAGQATTVKLNAYPDWQIPGEVITIIPTADRSKATVKVRVRFKQKDPRILPEMGARVAFLGDAQPAQAAPRPGIIVPSEAVTGSGDTGIVFVISGDKLERRTVRLGARTPEGQVVLSGLQAGEKLAIGPADKLADGAVIRVAP